MTEKRYSIVRVDKYDCPREIKGFVRRCLRTGIRCEQCYGDTKEQLIKKVAQAIDKARIDECKTFVEATNKIAKEIVEFLGVEE